MSAAPDLEADVLARLHPFSQPHLLGVDGLTPPDVDALLDLAEALIPLSRRSAKRLDLLTGRTVVNLFFENSTRTQASFELAARRLGADVLNLSPRTSSMSKGETLIDTAKSLNAMRPDILVVRHGASGAAHLLARHTEAAVVNAGDGAREHPTQALLDALTLRRAFGRLAGLTVAICGDVLHSRVARSNTALLGLMSAHVRLCGPPTLLPTGVDRWGAEVFTDLDAAIAGADAVMMLRLQTERMDGAYVPSPREYARFWGLTRERLARAAPGAKVLHPGPMNRGVEITGELADDPMVSLIAEQVEMGVAVRMAVLASLSARSEAG
ncbi:MAG: aspartate carbamoyltransferase catalytic subunit [Proteobacteria bacterium]|nr:aspartate carbamoyltransferase catalytic subunit [Pseudomonadota bacterium]